MLTKSFHLVLPGIALCGLAATGMALTNGIRPLASESAAAAAVAFGDVDGDGLDDAFVIGTSGQSQLFLNFGEGRFEDITAAANLSELGGASCALFADFDGDGRQDLFVGSSQTRLWRNVGQASFEPMQSGIDHDLVDLGAQAVDHDRDGLVDLQIRTEVGEIVYRNRGEGRFQRVELPFGQRVEGSSTTGWVAPGSLASEETISPAQRRLGRWARGRALAGGSTSVAFGSSLSNPSTSISASCMPGVRDANGGACIGASSVPTLGMLFPLSTELFVDSVTGYVGMGTTFPQEKLQIGEYFVTAEDNFIEMRTIGGGTNYQSGLKLRASNPFFGFDIVHDDLTKGLDIRRWDNDFSAFGESAIFINRLNGRVGVGTNLPEAGLSVTTTNSTLTPTTQGVHMGIECCGYAGSTSLEIVSDSTGSPHLDFNALGSGQSDYGGRLLWSQSNDELQVYGAQLTVFDDICATGNIGTCSDARFKTNVEEIEGALALVEGLRGVRYDWRRDDYPERNFSAERQVGFLAQELLEVVPEAVQQSGDGYYSVDYGKLTPVLVEAMHEQQREIEALQTLGTRCSALESENADLRQRLTELESMKAELASLRSALEGHLDR